MDQRAILLLSSVLTPDDFHHPRHRRVWGAMLAMHERGDGIDYLSLQAELGRDLDGIGGAKGMASLLEDGTTPQNVETYARQVIDAATKRRLLAASAEIKEAAMLDGPADLSVDLAQRAIGNIAARGMGKGSQPLHRAVRELAIKMFKRIDEGAANPGILTGFAELDEITSGFQPADFIVIGGRPSMGKSALAVAMANHIALAGWVYFFSVEMPAEGIALRWLGQTTGIDTQLMRHARLSDGELLQIGKAAGECEKLKLEIDECSDSSVHYLRNRSRILAIDKPPRAIFVDYLQLLRYPGKDDPRHETTAISGALKALARELQCPVIALSQLSRSLEARQDKRPMMSDLRESGAIEQDADIVLFPYRDAVYNKKADKTAAELIVAKQRNGNLGTISLHFDRGRYLDPERFDATGQPRLSFGAEPVTREQKQRTLPQLVEGHLRRAGRISVDDLVDVLQREGWSGPTSDVWAVLDRQGWEEEGVCRIPLRAPAPPAG